MRPPTTSTASDYATLSTDNVGCYYGYETVWCPTHEVFSDCNSLPESCDECETEWCFVAEVGDRTIKIPQSKLGASDKWDCRENLLMGIGWLLTKWTIAVDGEPA